MTSRHRKILADQLNALSRHTCPFADSVPTDISPHARWVIPKLVGVEGAPRRRSKPR